MFLTPGKKIPIMQDNATFEMHEGGFYTIERHNNAGKLVSTTFFQPSCNGPICKGVVVEKEGQPLIN